MKYNNTLIAVKDMDESLKFYKELFDQDVVVDLDWCKSLTCGLTLQKFYHKIVGFPEESMTFKSHAMELYFETDDFDDFMELLEKHPEVEKLHEAKTYPWLQRGIHIYDPSGHIIEVGESMYRVAWNLFDQGKQIKETAEIIQHPMDLVEEWYNEYLKQL